MDSVTKIVVDVIIWLIIGCIGLGLELVASPSTPFQRGFYCDDESIRYPYHDDTISTALLIAVGLGIPIITMVFVEWFLHSKLSKTNKPFYSRISLGKYSIHPYAVALYSTIGPMLFGLVVTFLLTNCSKYLIGRLRPHFISVCEPDWSRINCTDEEGYPIYVEQAFCTGENRKLQTDARLSFPSGHSSCAFYLFVYWAVYLQQRFVFSPTPLIRPFLQVVGISLAVFCAETRVSDYKHHAGDVVAGGFLGTVIVILTVIYISDLYSKTLASIPSSEVHVKNDQAEAQKTNYGTVDYKREMSAASNVTCITEAAP
ncbi:Phospholipid phosphatase 1 [Holothuria leucospilota]|uniref:Phospholipid phosphatase 1 n=1 Tax=Holothuria leucospilota TaxID=206669 RepID=A0A9Q1CFT9_HOLLE|nr:Phospholipid phosphatase 1 [Holothuria leucospilota]